MPVFDPKSHEFQSELIAVYQSMLSSNTITGEVVPSVILIRFGEGEGAPRFRSMRSEDWEASRSSAGNADWVPAAEVNPDGQIVLLLK